MRLRIVGAISAALIAICVVVLVVAQRAAERLARQPRVVTRLAPVSNNPVRVVKTNVLLNARSFSWREVESEDYATYVYNLRSIGCPETTIRDIIVADVNHLFARKRREEQAQRDLEWWRSEPSEQYREMVEGRERALESERQALLTKLLGPKWQEETAALNYPVVSLAGPVLGALPEETKEAVMAITSRSVDRMREYYKTLRESGEAADDIELAKIREQTRAELAALLSPSQLEEFLLRYSQTSGQLREELRGLNATPEEFRAIFRAVDQIDRDLQLRYSGDDPLSRTRREQLDRERLAAIREALGPTRFREYQMAQEPEFRDAMSAAKQAGASPEAGLALYEIAQAGGQERNRINNDPSLTPEQKRALVEATQREEQRARAELLGEPLPPEPETPTAGPPLRTHTVSPGETLAHLSLRYGVRMSAIREANPSIDFGRLQIGDLLNIPPPAPGTSTPIPMRRQ